MGLLSRQKGKRWERELAQMFRRIFGEGVRRSLAQARSGSEAADLEGVPFYWVEAKHHHRVNIRKALEQARDACVESGKVPLVCAKDDREVPMAAMYLPDFLALLERAHKSGQIEAAGSPSLEIVKPQEG